jgi:hypothetical protein
MTRLEKDLVALPALSSVQLGERWRELGGGEAPSIPSSLLRRLLAQRLQEKRYGALPLMVVRELERAMSASTGASAGQLPRRDLVLTPGTRLIREWNGRTIAVEVTGEGRFLWNDQCYRSLSEIARTVTGAHWSGPRFFGLKSRG